MAEEFCLITLDAHSHQDAGDSPQDVMYIS